jgi:hypothetical protein
LAAAVLDRTAGATARAQLAEADTQLAEDAGLHAHRWFVDRKDQTLRLIRELPEGANVDADAVQLVGESLLAELDRPDLPDAPAQDLYVNDLGHEGLEPVTNQVTTTSGNGRRSATHSDADIPLARGNPTQPDTIGRNRPAW